MADTNYNPEYSEQINDIPPKEEVKEKPYYNDTSDPNTQLLNNNNQSQSDNNNDIPSQINSQQGNQKNSSEVPYYNSNNTINDNGSYNQPEANNNEQQVQIDRIREEEKSKKKMIALNIILIIVVIIDSILEIIFKIFNPFILGDDIAILIIAITYLILIAIKKRTNHPGIIAATLIVGIVGLGVKGYGVMQNLREKGFFITIFVLIGIRSLTIFFLLPNSCKCDARSIQNQNFFNYV